MPGLEGTRLGRYRLLRRLGRGGMSEVYLANDELMHREVALKVVSSTHTEYIERFQREAEAIGNLQHDHILPAFDYGEQAPWHYLVMPYIEHRTLFELLEQGPLSLEDAGILLQQIADGLQYAHDHGVIHRDIKPSNILLGDDRYAYLADFGLAKPIEGAGKVTQTGVLLGTPEYMAPELADGPASKSSDIYALGILLYQMVTGRTPFTADTALAVYLKQMREQPIPPSRINPAIPHAVDLVILRALDKDPRRRYETPLALAQAYMRALNQGQSQSPPAFQQTPMLYETAEMESELPPSPTLPAQPRKNTPAFTPPLEPLTPVESPQQDKLYIPAYPSYPPYHPESPPVARSPAAGAPGTRVRPTPTPPRRHISADRRKRRPGIGLTLLVGLLVFIMLAAGFYVLLHLPGSQTNPGPATPSVGTTNTASVSKTPTTSPGATSTAQSLATQQAAYATATALTGTTPLLSDSLSSNTNNRWPNDGVGCAFAGSTYHVLVSTTDYLQPCSPMGVTFSNGAIKVDLSLLQGSDAGIILRANGDQFYDFEITDKGEFYFRRHDANAGATYVQLVPRTFSSAIAPNNTLFIIARGGDFQLFINGTFVKEVQDATYSSGQIGLVAGTLAPAKSADASFSNLTIYGSA